MRTRSRLVLPLLAAVLGIAGACRRDAEPAPPATAPDRPELPPGAGPPPSTVPSTAGPERRVALTLGSILPEAVAGLKLPAVGGQSIALGQARRDRGLLVVFTGNQCPYALAWEKRLVALGNEHAGLGLGVVFVNSNDPSQSPKDALDGMALRVQERGHRFPYVSDSAGVVARAFGAARTPEAFLFDSEGRLAYHGTVDDNAQAEDEVTAYWLKDALAAVVSGQPVPVAETKALGCAIKLAPAG